MDVSEFTKDQRVNRKIHSKFSQELRNSPCFLGIDEAGRGPVLGPMVYAACVCPLQRKADLGELGCNDSKALSEDQRDELFLKLDSCTGSFVGWIVHILSPEYISKSMLRHTKYNLNSISHDTAIDLIKSVQASGVQLAEAYVDTVGCPVKYHAELKARFPAIDITVESKADATYPIVGAASICAKVCRDKTVRTWNFPGMVKTHNEYGSGYPSDPKTKAWLRRNVDSIFGFPHFVRFSWSTAKSIMDDEAVSVEWPDDEEDETQRIAPPITNFFGSHKSKRVRHSYFEGQNLQPVRFF